MTTTIVHGTCRYCEINQGWYVVAAEGKLVCGMTSHYPTKQSAWRAFRAMCERRGWEWNTMLTIPRGT